MIVKNLIKEHVDDVIDNVNRRYQDLQKAITYDALPNKLRSTLMSNMLEAAMADIMPDTVSPFTDHEPDLYVKDTALEIKTTTSSSQWLGGVLSKRPGEYLMTSFSEDIDSIKWFILHTHLVESDWSYPPKRNYNGTTITLDYLLENTPAEIIKGSVHKKIKRQHIIWS